MDFNSDGLKPELSSHCLNYQTLKCTAWNQIEAKTNLLFMIQFMSFSKCLTMLCLSSSRQQGGVIFEREKNLALGKLCTALREIVFPRYTMKCSGENVILRGIFHVVSGFPLHFMLYPGKLDCFSNSAQNCFRTPNLKCLVEMLRINLPQGLRNV